MSLGISYDRWKKQSHEEVPPVVLASGPESQLKETFVENLLDECEESPEYVKYFADETDPKAFLQELRGKGLFNEQKWIILKHLEKSSPGGKKELTRYLDILQDYVTEPEPGTTLFLFDSDHPYRRGRKLGTLAEAVQSNDGWSLIFWEPFEDAIRSTVQQKLSEAGLDFDPAAVQRLLERTRGKYDRVVAETQKLIDAVEDKVQLEHVEAIVSREESSDGFDSMKRNFVLENVSKLIRDFDEFWRRNEPPPRVVHVLYEFIDDLRTLQQLTSAGSSLEDALEELGRPTSRDVKDLYKKGMNWVRKGLPRSLYRSFYRLEKQSKYADTHLDEEAVEMESLKLLSSRERR